jgi:hypothetical protein
VKRIKDPPTDHAWMSVSGGIQVELKPLRVLGINVRNGKVKIQLPNGRVETCREGDELILGGWLRVNDGSE